MRGSTLIAPLVVWLGAAGCGAEDDVVDVREGVRDVCESYRDAMSECFREAGLDHDSSIGYQDECERRARDRADIEYFRCLTEKLSESDCSVRGNPLNSLNVAYALAECSPP